MNFDQLRALAGMPTKNDAKSRETLIESSEVLDFVVPESAVGKVAITLAKEGLPVDITFDGIDSFYFNFKTASQQKQAEKLAKSYVKEEAEGKFTAREDHDTKDGSWYVDNPDGSMHSKGLPEAEAKALAAQLNGEQNEAND